MSKSGGLARKSHDLLEAAGRLFRARLVGVEARVQGGVGAEPGAQPARADEPLTVPGERCLRPPGAPIAPPAWLGEP